MVVHHAVRLCICCIRGGSSSSGSGNSGQAQAAQNAAATAPQEIQRADEGYLLLYCYITTMGKMPFAETTYLGKQLGSWTVRTLQRHDAGTLTATELAALSRMPLWPRKVAPVVSQPPMYNEKAPLLAN